MGKKFAEMLELYSETKHLKKKLVIETFIAAGVKYDIVRENWTDDLRRDLEIEIEREAARSGCVALAISTDGEKKKDYRCVWFRDDKPPQIRKLGNSEDMQKAACLACGKTAEVAQGLKERDTRIADLENKIQLKAKITNKVPICNRGAILSQAGKVFRLCPKSSVPVSISGFCRVQSHGLPCALYAEIVLSEGPK